MSDVDTVVAAPSGPIVVEGEQNAKNNAVEPVAEIAPEIVEPIAEAAEEPETPAQTKKPWQQARIDQLVKEKWDERRRADTLATEIAALRAGSPAATQSAATTAQTYSQQDVQTQARAMVESDKFNARCNEIFSKGNADVPGFKESIANFELLGGLGSHMPLLQAVTRLPNAEAVLHKLGGDLDEFSRITSLPVMDQAMELSRISSEMRAPKPKTISTAPAPISPVTGGTVTAVPGPNSNGEFKTQEDYKAWRSKQFKRR